MKESMAVILYALESKQDDTRIFIISHTNIVVNYG